MMPLFTEVNLDQNSIAQIYTHIECWGKRGPETFKLILLGLGLIAVGMILLWSGLFSHSHRAQALFVKPIIRGKSGAYRILSCGDSPLQSAIML